MFHYNLLLFLFLLKFVFDALLMILVLRVWLQLVRADFYNPLSQFIVKVSNPLVIPLRRLIPGLGGVDLPTIILAYLVATLTFVIIPLINGGPIDFAMAFYLGLIYLIKQTGMLLFIIMLWYSSRERPTWAVAGVFFASYTQLSPSMWVAPLIIAVAVVIVGGIGSIIGTLIVAHIIGFMEVLTTSLIAPELRGVFTMALIIIVLVVSPKGLFGREEIH